MQLTNGFVQACVSGTEKQPHFVTPSLQIVSFKKIEANPNDAQAKGDRFRILISDSVNIMQGQWTDYLLIWH
jgi:hypothetical protein